MAVAVGFIDHVMYLVPLEDYSKTDFEPRITEIFIEVSHSRMLANAFHVKII